MKRETISQKEYQGLELEITLFSTEDVLDVSQIITDEEDFGDLWNDNN